MFKQCIRSASSTTKRAVRSSKPDPKDKKTTLDRFLPQGPKKAEKEWEKRGMTKDEFFIKKYSFMSDDKKKKLQEKTERQERFKQHKRDHEKETKAQNQPEAGNWYKNYKERYDAYKQEEDAEFFDQSLYEMLYGRHAILSAIKCKKRQSLEKLYYSGGSTPISDILDMCKKYGIKTEQVEGRRKLDQLTNYGVHNGVVLRTRKLELPSLASLGKAYPESSTYELTLWNPLFNSQIKTTKAVVRPPDESSPSRYPLGLYLDEITDPQNVGAIIRTSYFLGVDFIVTPSHNSARLGPVTAKAAAGALDLMDLYTVENGLKFMRSVKVSDWSIITTDSKISPQSVDHTQLPSILQESPVLLVLGSEGAGVRTNIKNLSDFFVSVPKNRQDFDAIVDSINVSAATSVLISKLLQ